MTDQLEDSILREPEVPDRVPNTSWHHDAFKLQLQGLTAREIGNACKVSRQAVYDLFQRGKIPERYRGTWPPERIAELTNLWKGGQSASQIAATMRGGLTRGAVIGKLHRLKMQERDREEHPTRARVAWHKGYSGIKSESVQPSRAKPPRPEPSLAAPRQRLPGLKLLAPMLPMMPEPVPLDGGLTLLQLTSKTCKWPIGDPGKAGFCFCGQPPREKSPYCAGHHRKAFVQ